MPLELWRWSLWILTGVVQGVLSNGLWWLLIIGGGAVLGFVKNRWPNSAGAALYGVLGAAAIAIICFAAVGRPLLSPQQSQTTPENVESNVKVWAEDLGLGIQRMPSAPDTFFRFTVTLKNGNPVMIARATALPGYLQLQTVLVLSPEHQADMSKLTKDQAANVMQEVILELARSKLGNMVAGPVDNPMQNITLIKSVPIANVTEGSFPAYLDELDSGISLVRSATALALQRKSQTVPMTPEVRR